MICNRRIAALGCLGIKTCAQDPFGFRAKLTKAVSILQSDCVEHKLRIAFIKTKLRFGSAKEGSTAHPRCGLFILILLVLALAGLAMICHERIRVWYAPEFALHGLPENGLVLADKTLPSLCHGRIFHSRP